MTAPPVQNFRLDAAISYAMRGWQVIPLHWPKVSSMGAAKCSCKDPSCSSIGKHPLTENGLKDATLDVTRVTEWWRRYPSANVGIVTGRISGLVVLDCDVKGDGPASLATLQDRHGELPPTIEVITGSGGGHRFFAHPGNIVVANSSKKIGPGLDVRGDGGYVVAPPSLHAKGERYAWDLCAGPDESELAQIPKWLLDMMVPPSRKVQPATHQSVDGRKWLGDALAKASPGNRSEQGQRLACQLRDNNVPRGEAEALMRDYAARVPAGDHAYTEREALATYESVMRSPAREPAKCQTPRQSATEDKTREALVSPPPPGAADELDAYMTGVIEGRIYNVPFPWDTLTEATQALQPGSFCLLGGDPGVGKTFFVLQCLRRWHGEDIKPAIFFAEKDRPFYLRRLLAQLEASGNFIKLGWINAHAGDVRAAMARHKAYLDDLGKTIWIKPPGKLTLDLMLGWIRDRAKDGHRVIVVDPITAVDPGAERWSKESDFVQTCQDIMNEYGVSLILTTHPKQSSGKTGTTSGHDAAGGAAYFRFVDTMIWLTRAKQPRRVECNHATHGTIFIKTPHFVRLLKTRDGVGAGWELAYEFGHRLAFQEHGVVVKDVKASALENDVKDPFGAPSPMSLAMNHLDLDEDVA